MVPPDSVRIPRVPTYSGTHSAVHRTSRTGPSPCLAGRPRPFRCPTAFSSLAVRPTTPPTSPPAVWANPLSLAATEGISFDFFSCRYLDGSLPGVYRPHAIDSRTDDCHSRQSGYPIRTPRDQSLLAAPPGFSQLSASFFAWQLLGIHSWTHIHLTILFFRLPSLKIQKTMEAKGFEPLTLGLQSRCSSQLSYAPDKRTERGRVRRGSPLFVRSFTLRMTSY